MEWLTTMWTDNPLLLVGIAVLVYVMLGGKVPPFLLELFKPKTPTEPAPNQPAPDIDKLIQRLLPTLLDLFTKQGLTGPQHLTAGHHHCESLAGLCQICDMACEFEKAGDTAAAEACYALVVPYMKLHAKP